MTESNMQVSPGSIFICYRREDTADVTGRIYDRLVDHFRPERVFMDVEAIRLGYDFRSEIDQTIKVCSIVIVVIGDKWLAEVDGKRRIDDENDRVRIEIEAALRREIPIIPVLTRGASHPTKAILPASLEDLAYRHGTSIRHEHFRGDVDSLISQMDKSLARQESRPSKPAESSEPTTTVKSTASKEPAIWTAKRLIIVTAVGATMVLLLAITPSLTRLHPFREDSSPNQEPRERIPNNARPQPFDQLASAKQPEKRDFSVLTPTASPAATTVTQDITPGIPAKQSENRNFSVPPSSVHHLIPAPTTYSATTLPQDMAPGTIVNVNEVDGANCFIIELMLKPRDLLDLRSGPGENYSLVNKISVGEKRLLMEFSSTSSGTGSGHAYWVRVFRLNGEDDDSATATFIGWADKQFLMFEASQKR